MATNYNGGNQNISQPNFVRVLDVSGADFDGTDTANIADSMKTQESNGSKFNPWAKNGGFLFKLASSGTAEVLLYKDYERNGKVIDDSLSQIVTGIGGTYNEERVIKIYSTSTVTDMNIGTVIQ